MSCRAVIWFYVVARPLGFIILNRGHPWSSLKALIPPGVVTALILALYVFFGKTTVDQDDLNWTKNWIELHAPVGSGWSMIPISAEYVKTNAGSIAIWFGILAALVLLIRGQGLPLLVLGTSSLMLILVIANARWWILPLSFLLYPERAVYWATPLAVGS